MQSDNAGKKSSGLWWRIKKYPKTKWFFDYLFKVTDRLNFALYLSRVKRFQGAVQKAGPGPRVLIDFFAAGIGNAVEATPLVQAIRILWPKAYITLLTSQGDLFADWCIPDLTINSLEMLRGRTFDYTFVSYWGGFPLHDHQQYCDPGRVHYPRFWNNKFPLKPEREYNISLLTCWM